MRFVIDRKKVFALLDVLVARWQAREYPYNRPDAIIPQTIIPKELRANQHTLACWYFYACIYMRGGIESLQAFNALIRMWRDLPHLFDPGHAMFMHPVDVQLVLREYIGWDSKEAGKNWVFNSRWLMQVWGGDPLRLIKGLRSYEEAERRIRNKRLRRELHAAGSDGAGFRGFQAKMVSMLLYFYDWEGQQPGNTRRWLYPRFLYPSPADFHNFRLGISTGGILIEPTPEEQTEWDILRDSGQEPYLRFNEKLSAPWRAAVMAYLRSRKADPVEVADALWLYSLVMCGNSPMTVSKEVKPRVLRIKNKKTGEVTERPNPGLFEHSNTTEEWEPGRWAARKHTQLKQTCLACVLANWCGYAIPSRPYYRKGKLVLRPRPRVERHYTRILPPPKLKDVIVEPAVRAIIPGLEHPLAAE